MDLVFTNIIQYNLILYFIWDKYGNLRASGLPLFLLQSAIM